MNYPACYKSNSQYFAGGGPSIVSCLFRKKKEQEKSEEKPVKSNITFERTETNSSLPPSYSEIPQNSTKPQISTQFSQYPQQRQPIKIQLSEPKTIIDYQDNIPKEDPKTRNLSPGTLEAMLNAELDHFIKIESEIGQVAEIVGNVQVADHEQKVAQTIVYNEDEDDSKEMEELDALDNEIARLEEILAYKLEQKRLQDEEYYSYGYYSDYSDEN